LTPNDCGKNGGDTFYRETDIPCNSNPGGIAGYDFPVFSDWLELIGTCTVTLLSNDNQDIYFIRCVKSPDEVFQERVRIVLMQAVESRLFTLFRRDNARLTERLRQAELIIEVQKKCRR